MYEVQRRRVRVPESRVQENARIQVDQRRTTLGCVFVSCPAKVKEASQMHLFGQPECSSR